MPTRDSYEALAVSIERAILSDLAPVAPRPELAPTIEQTLLAEARGNEIRLAFPGQPANCCVPRRHRTPIDEDAKALHARRTDSVITHVPDVRIAHGEPVSLRHVRPRGRPQLLARQLRLVE